MNENGQTKSVNIRQGEEELCVASWAWGRATDRSGEKCDGRQAQVAEQNK